MSQQQMLESKMLSKPKKYIMADSEFIMLRIEKKTRWRCYNKSRFD